MRTIVLSSILLFAVQLFSQTSQSALDLGPVEVRLGMQKSDVLKKFSGAGFNITDPDASSGLLPDGKRLVVMNKGQFSKDEAKLNVYFIAFTAGRLSYAERSWLDEKDPLASVIEAVNSLTAGRPRECSVTYSPASSPGASSNRVFIDCGNRSLLLMRGEYEMSGSKGLRKNNFT